MEQRTDERTAALREILSSHPFKLVLSNGKGCDYQKIVVQYKDEGYYQLEKYTQKQVFHENVPPDSLSPALEELLKLGYRQLNSYGADCQMEMKLSKKGKVLLNRRNQAVVKPTSSSHNKEENYILKEGTIIPPLVELGIFTPDGRVVKAMYDKYRQINRFIEIVDDAVSSLDENQELTIVDFGCGKSYLTFILYYYFVELRHRPVKMIGLDLKADVIQHCNQVAKKYGYEHLTFQMGDINGFRYDGVIDMVITLHACDTATDFALYNAIQWNAKMIFSVPCCQHELNGQIKTETLSVLTKYGIIQERVAALLTDGIRGSLLEACGYRTQLLEFVDLTHSPKNILIRAVRSNLPLKKRMASLKEVKQAMETFSVDPTLYRLLSDAGRLPEEKQ